MRDQERHCVVLLYYLHHTGVRSVLHVGTLIERAAQSLTTYTLPDPSGIGRCVSF